MISTQFKPHVQKLLIVFSNRSALEHDSLICSPLTINVLQQNVSILNISLSVYAGIAGEDIVNVLQEHANAVPGSYLDEFTVTISRLGGHVIGIAFVFSRHEFGTAMIPIFRLESESVFTDLHCHETVNDTVFDARAVIVKTQSLERPKTFSLTLDQEKFTPQEPLNVPAYQLEEHLTELVSYQCNRTLSGSVWYADLFEDQCAVQDAPRAFCDCGSRRNPRAIWTASEDMAFVSLFVRFLLQ